MTRAKVSLLLTLLLATVALLLWRLPRRPVQPSPAVTAEPAVARPAMTLVLRLPQSNQTMEYPVDPEAPEAALQRMAEEIIRHCLPDPSGSRDRPVELAAFEARIAPSNIDIPGVASGIQVSETVQITARTQVSSTLLPMCLLQPGVDSFGVGYRSDGYWPIEGTRTSLTGCTELLGRWFARVYIGYRAHLEVFCDHPPLAESQQLERTQEDEIAARLSRAIRDHVSRLPQEREPAHHRP